MQEAWIDLACPNCDKQWEANPTELPAPDADFECPDCGTSRSTAEFAQTQRGLEILESFHES